MMVVQKEAFIANFVIVMKQFLEKELPDSGEEDYMINRTWEAIKYKTGHLNSAIQSIKNGGVNNG